MIKRGNLNKAHSQVRIHGLIEKRVLQLPCEEKKLPEIAQPPNLKVILSPVKVEQLCNATIFNQAPGDLVGLQHRIGDPPLPTVPVLLVD